MHRATAGRLAEARQCVLDYETAANVHLGPLEREVAEHEIAQTNVAPFGAIVELPSSRTMSQARHLDDMRETARSVRPRPSDDNEWAEVRLELGGGIVQCRLNMDDIRRAFGLPAGINFVASGIVGATVDTRPPEEDNSLSDPDHE